MKRVWGMHVCVCVSTCVSVCVGRWGRVDGGGQRYCGVRPFKQYINAMQ